MDISLFDYKLPQNLIAQKPAVPRDSCKLMVLDKEKKMISHHFFYDLDKFLQKGDVLVFNDTKVYPARLLGKKATGGKMEVLLLRQISNNLWEAMVGGKNKKEGMEIFFDGISAVLEKRIDNEKWLVNFKSKKKDIMKIIFKIGKMPIPPYIKNPEEEQALKKEYQTIYAQNIGSAAAPTAGLHFTKRLLNKLQKKGVKLEFVTLHVGLGTFAPIRVQDILEHKIHSEWGEVKKETLKNIISAKKQGNRIIAVGTTSTRILEGAVSKYLDKKIISDFNGLIDIFIYPGYKFKVVDSMITNFHLPKSSLLVLVSAFCGREFILDAYKQAVKKKYKFYSFGDTMIIKSQAPNPKTQ